MAIDLTTEVTILFADLYRIEGYDRFIFKWWFAFFPLIALMILLACWRGSVRLVQWWNKPRCRPRRLYRKLIRTHRLNRTERTLLVQLLSNLPRGAPPAILFADPGSWGWTQIADTQTIDSLEKLYLKIFGFPRDRSGI